LCSKGPGTARGLLTYPKNWTRTSKIVQILHRCAGPRSAKGRKWLPVHTRAFTFVPLQRQRGGIDRALVIMVLPIAGVADRRLSYEPLRTAVRAPAFMSNELYDFLCGPSVLLVVSSTTGAAGNTCRMRSQVKNYSPVYMNREQQNMVPAHGVARSGRCVLVRAMSQQLNGCAGWVYVRGRCAFSDFSLSLSKFIAFGACLTLYLPRAARARVQ
jgi:hypothetical protein